MPSILNQELVKGSKFRAKISEVKFQKLKERYHHNAKILLEHISSYCSITTVTIQEQLHGTVSMCTFNIKCFSTRLCACNMQQHIKQLNNSYSLSLGGIESKLFFTKLLVLVANTWIKNFEI